MIKNKTILMPFSLPWDWSADYQRQTCRVLSKHNRIIAYFPFKANFFLKETPRLDNSELNKFVEPYVPQNYFPLKRCQIIDHLNKTINLKILAQQLPGDTILWLFDPIFFKYPLVLNNTLSFSLYDCVDYHDSTDLEESRQIRQQENQLIENADLFFTNSKTLQQLHQPYQSHLVPQGFSLNIFKNPPTKKFELDHSKPIIGFVGGINYRLDYNLLISLASDNQQWQFVLYGPIQEISDNQSKDFEQKLNNLKKLDNVILGPSIKKKYVPALIKELDIGMIPYDISIDFNKYCYPMKLFEYFFMGKPVISTPIKELFKFNQLVKIGDNSRSWGRIISQLLKHKWPKELVQKQKQLAIRNGWENKIEEILNITQSAQTNRSI